METDVILHGDALTVLRGLPSASVHMCITSPPFWGLRTYGTEPQLWDADPSCEHEWGPEQCSPWANELPGPSGRKKNVQATRERSKESGNFCQRCGAWRGELGGEPSPDLYVAHLVAVFREVFRVLRDDGTCWVNIADSYAGSWGNYAPRGIRGEQRPRTEEGKRWERRAYGDTTWKPPAAGLEARGAHGSIKGKDLCLIPQRLALALQASGWYVRADVIWSKKNCMPESVTDRPTRSHEYLYLLAKRGSPTYWTHRDGMGSRTRPAPNYRWRENETGEETDAEPPHWRSEALPDGRKRWARCNLWEAHDYYYDADAIREPAATFRAEGPQAFRGQAALRPRGKPTVDRAATFRRPNSKRGDVIVPGQGYGTHRPDREDTLSSGWRNKRDVWSVATRPFNGAHFAVFPQALIEPCVLASSAARACEHCGAPWQRRTERSTSFEGGSDKAGRSAEDANAHGKWAGVQYGRNVKLGPVLTVTTTGWQPTCHCPANTGSAQCLVLDPFMGSGTSALVALKHGRHYAGIELNAEYIALAEKRIKRGVQRVLWSA